MSEIAKVDAFAGSDTSRDLIMEAAAGLVQSLAAALGPGSEVVLHDLDRLPNSIVAIANPITGRTLGDPPTDLLLQDIRDGRFVDRYRYRARTPSGRELRSSTLFLKDTTGRPIGTLCINQDVTNLELARGILMSELETGDPSIASLPAGAEVVPEAFAHGVEELASGMIERALATVPVPVEFMRKQHKLSVVRDLDSRGFFLVRDAVEMAARALNVTRYSIYNYLNELAAERTAENNS